MLDKVQYDRVPEIGHLYIGTYANLPVASRNNFDKFWLQLLLILEKRENRLKCQICGKLLNQNICATCLEEGSKKAKAKKCKCGADIIFLKTKSGKPAPYTATGRNHFADCPFSKDFRR